MRAIQDQEGLAGYDQFASFYNRHWCGQFHPWAVALIDKLIVPGVPAGSRVLDLCCGTGRLAGELSTRGYSAFGLDASEQMLRYAHEHAPSSPMICADARGFAFRPSFACVTCLFDSINHILSGADLERVFQNVYECLIVNGRFVFDVLLEEAYLRDWTQTCTIVQDDHACFIRGGYTPEAHMGRTEVTLFSLNDHWERTDTTFFERFHPPSEISNLLDKAGFRRISCLNAASELGIDSTFSNGRAVFIAHR